MQIEMITTADLVPYARNARTHPEWQIAQIAASIAEFGFCNPILVGGDGVIIAGHGRLMAADQLGLEQVPVIRLGHLSEAQRRALVIADNKIAENASWDEDLLRSELAALRDDDVDLSILGFDLDEIDGMLDAAEAAFDGGAGDDARASSGGQPGAGTLSERFGVVPFSVIDTRRDWWLDRLAYWERAIGG